ncbi:LysR family transcriptional regulator [Elioraea sp.]|uniref:LysR family transcriptional regulator n=1 Tax=Elioraea sp. TaxID=2185103 RepID=UPI0021DD43D9|nr:LysR family transcriptional regulator [Elioraea sp.]GIX10745.1 MAG: LysR family transcriptional regulator [Elioraea sp.]
MSPPRPDRGPDWALWRSFLAVLRSGSLSASARSLGLAHPTLRRHIATLESALGATLFTRSPAGLLPTAVALSLRPAAEAMEAAAARLLRDATAGGAAPAGTIRLTASEVLGAEVLPALLAGLRERHPGLDVELVLSNETLDVLRRDADIAVRMYRPRTEGLVAQRIGTVELGFFAHQSWIARHGEPRDLAALIEAGVLIGPDRETALPRALAAQGFATTREAFVFRSDSDLACLGALRAGLGVGVCQVPLARRMPELRRVLPGLGGSLEVWLVTHPDLRQVPRVRAALAALSAGLRRYLAAGFGPSSQAPTESAPQGPSSRPSCQRHPETENPAAR